MHYKLLSISSIIVYIFFSALLTSCDEIYHTNSGNPSGYYYIDPVPGDSLPAFPVYCDMSSSTVKTIVHHNLESRSKASCCTNPFICNLAYSNNGVSISMNQLAVMADNFHNCLYHYKHECYENGLSSSYWCDRNWGPTNDWAGTSTMCNNGEFIILIHMVYVS